MLVYLLLTPTGALRFAVLRNGYAINAVNLKLSENPCKTPIDMARNQTIYTFSNPPFEEDTKTPLENWVISKIWFLSIGGNIMGGNKF